MRLWHVAGVWTEADVAAAEIARRQMGVVHWSSLREAGLSPAMIERRAAAGMLVRVEPGVYALAGAPETPDRSLVAAVLSVGADAAISHDSAAFRWGMISRRPRDVHVVTRRWTREHRTTCRVHESLDLIPQDREWLDGVPVTTPERTLVDLGATSPWLVERALGTALQLGVVEITDVEAFVARVQRSGRRGVGVIRPFLELHRSVARSAESVLEVEFIRLLEESMIELPEAQYEVVDDHRGFVCRADFAYPARRLLIEVDGRSYHSDTKAFQRDRDKQNATQALGWRTLRFTASDIRRHPYRTADIVSSFLRN